MVKDEVLKYLEINKGKLVSGGELSKELNVSRTAVWKAVNSLKEQGYDIETVSKEGYKLSALDNTISEYAVKKNLNTEFIGKDIEIFKVINSTNTYLKENASQIPNQGKLVIAENQTQGKGRRGRSFFSPSQRGIYMSILLRPDIDFEDITMITVISAVAVNEALNTVLGIDTQIKWVNDILYNGKKLCGILTEASIEGEISHIAYLVVGIGINVSEGKEGFPQELKPIATSIESITDKYCDKNLLIAEIMNSFEKYYKLFKEIDGRKIIIETYKNKLVMLGKNIKVIQADKTYYAKALDINEKAELIIQQQDGVKKVLNSGEISIREI